MSSTATRRGMRRCSGDEATSAIELPIAVAGLVLVMLLTVGGLRISNMNSDVQSAAHAAARAAAAERTPLAAQAAASIVATRALAQSGVGCASPLVVVSGDVGGGVVRVQVTCTVSLSDVTAAGFPGSRTVTATAIEVTDQLRGGS